MRLIILEGRADNGKFSLLSHWRGRQVLDDHAQDSLFHGHPLAELVLDLSPGFPHFGGGGNVSVLEVLAVLAYHRVQDELDEHWAVSVMARLPEDLFLRVVVITPEELLEHSRVHSKLLSQLPCKYG